VRFVRSEPAAAAEHVPQSRPVLDSAAPHMMVAIALMMFTGLGPKNALRLPRTFYKDGAIATRRSKTAEPVFWPAPALLGEILSKAPAHNAITLCANSRGEPWTESGFRASWRTLRQQLESQQLIGPGLTLYGLRHTVAVILREAGADERTTRRCTWAEDNRDGAPLRSGRRSSGEDAWRRGKL
jgi:integrase